MINDVIENMGGLGRVFGVQAVGNKDGILEVVNKLDGQHFSNQPSLDANMGFRHS